MDHEVFKRAGAGRVICSAVAWLEVAMLRAIICAVAVIATTTVAAAGDPSFRGSSAYRPSQPTILNQVLRGRQTILNQVLRGNPTILRQVLDGRLEIRSPLWAAKNHWRLSLIQSYPPRWQHISWP